MDLSHLHEPILQILSIFSVLQGYLYSGLSLVISLYPSTTTIFISIVFLGRPGKVELIHLLFGLVI